MGLSLIQIQREVILNYIKASSAGARAGGWKVVVVDEDSRRLIDNVMREDDILSLQVTNIEQIEHKRQRNPDTDALYLISPQPHIVDCVIADLEKRRYAGFHILWTSILTPPLRDRLSRATQGVDFHFQVTNVDFNPREAQLVTFKDPYSFPILFHPSCADLVRFHISQLAQKIMSVCVSLGENPIIRYYRPREPTHEAHILSEAVAQAVQSELETYIRFNGSPDKHSTNRPRATLYIVDRSMDICAPFIHEFSYQAMAQDLLSIKEGSKITYKVVLNEGQPNEEQKDMEITDKDKIWVDYRHLHMVDVIEKIQDDFKAFTAANPHFESDSATTNVNHIKDMLAGLPQYQENKEAYSLHLSMAGECMNIFSQHKLGELSALEQTLSTGLDEDYKKPKNVADQLVRMLDEDAIVSPDRLRLIALFTLFKYGLVKADIIKLLLHAKLPVQDEAILGNLELLGARIFKALKDTKVPPPPIFPAKPPPVSTDEEQLISRFEPALQSLLNDHMRGALDPNTFPYVRPDQAPSAQDLAAQSTSSLRSAKPTWAKSRQGNDQPRQRVIVFMAGGATFSESRACYQVSEQSGRDVVLVTSHMLTPGLFLRQLGDLSVDRRRLGLPQDQPAKRPPAHIFEDDRPTPPPSQGPGPGQSMKGGSGRGLPGRPMGGQMGMSTRPPVEQMNNMSLGSNGAGSSRPSSGRKEREDADKKKKKHLWSRH